MNIVFYHRAPREKLIIQWVHQAYKSSIWLKNWIGKIYFENLWKHEQINIFCNTWTQQDILVGYDKSGICEKFSHLSAYQMLNSGVILCCLILFYISQPCRIGRCCHWLQPRLQSFRQHIPMDCSKSINRQLNRAQVLPAGPSL